jgi:F0F1-type ATP synthase membrane subunit a
MAMPDFARRDRGNFHIKVLIMNLVWPFFPLFAGLFSGFVFHILRVSYK